MDYSLQEHIGPVDAMARFHERLRLDKSVAAGSKEELARGKRKAHNIVTDQAAGSTNSPRPLANLPPGSGNPSTPVGSVGASPRSNPKRTKAR